MLKGNKGEWSEIYAFCYLLCSGMLISADKDLNPIENIYFPVIKIIRESEEGESLDYFTGDNIQIYKGNRLLKELSKDDLKKTVNLLLEKIPQGVSSFEITETNDFFDSIYVHKLKADSNNKEDITIQIHDINTGISPICGFSIKSHLGANPTLINAGKNTNFVFTVNNCNDNIMRDVNSVNSSKKIMNRVKLLLDNNCEIVSDDLVDSPQFMENLQFIDSLMPSIIGNEVLIAYESNYLGIPKSVKSVTEELKLRNPLGYSNTKMYEYKIKKLLCACALGMTPEKLWDGSEDANGGYIVVKNNGSVVCYHLYNRTDFEQYLYDYTVFDSPSTSRHKYAEVYKENEKYKMKFNLQIRFN